MKKKSIGPDAASKVVEAMTQAEGNEVAVRSWNGEGV